MNKKDNSSRRLEELAKQWSQETPGLFDKFTAADLQLMLQYFQPLQQLIQAIAQGQEASVVALTQQEPADSASSEDVETLQNKVHDLEEALNVSQEESNQLQQQAEKDKEELKQAVESIKSQTKHIETLQQKLSSLTTEHEKQQTQLTEDIKKAHAQLQQAQSSLQQEQQKSNGLSQQLSAVQVQLREYQPSAELMFLRNTPELAQALGLSLPESDQQAMIATVAVLAQKDNLERLWDNLKDRCESGKRAATSDEYNLLAAALAWYNNNWKTRPFQLLTTSASLSYDFEKQQKAKHQTDGETVSQVWLPGIADGAGKPVRKTLVLTQ